MGTGRMGTGRMGTGRLGTGRVPPPRPPGKRPPLTPSAASAASSVATSATTTTTTSTAATTTSTTSTTSEGSVDVVAAATAKHRAAIGLSPVSKRTPAQQGFLAALAMSPISTSGKILHTTTNDDTTEKSFTSFDYRKKRAENIEMMSERRRMNQVISNVQKLDQQLTFGSSLGGGMIPQLRLSALPPKPILRQYNLLADDDMIISSSDDDMDSDEYVETYED